MYNIFLLLKHGLYIMDKPLRKAWCVMRKSNGNIAFLCGPWGAVSVMVANKDMQNRRRYYAQYIDGNGVWQNGAELTHYGETSVTTKGNEMKNDNLVNMPELLDLDYVDCLDNVEDIDDEDSLEYLGDEEYTDLLLNESIIVYKNT